MSPGLGAVDPARLSLARRLRRMTRAELARRSELSPSAITQFEKGSVSPTPAAVARIGMALQVPAAFFHLGAPIERIDAGTAHFRSLRSTAALTRDQALAYAELVLSVVSALEEFVEFPHVDLPTWELEDRPDQAAIVECASATREALRLRPGPVPHVVRALEAAGCVVVRLPDYLSADVDAFSTYQGRRPLVLLSPSKSDKARSRFDAAHELGHLLMHPDVAPGSKLVEQQAQNFAAELLMPADEIVAELPRRLDWNAMMAAKRKWGVSLAALAYRARSLELWSDSTAQRAFRQLRSHGYPEAGSLGPQESSSLLGRAFALTLESGITPETFANRLGLPEDQLLGIISAGSEARGRVTLEE